MPRSARSFKPFEEIWLRLRDLNTLSRSGNKLALVFASFLLMTLIRKARSQQRQQSTRTLAAQQVTLCFVELVLAPTVNYEIALCEELSGFVGCFETQENSSRMG